MTGVESRGKSLAAILLFVAAWTVLAGEANEVVPMPKLRPEDPAR